MGAQAARSARQKIPAEPRRKQGSDARMGTNQAFICLPRMEPKIELI
jgi:hypothetical protein